MKDFHNNSKNLVEGIWKYSGAHFYVKDIKLDLKLYYFEWIVVESII
mgnify:CR=1 FL=1